MSKQVKKALTPEQEKQSAIILDLIESSLSSKVRSFTGSSLMTLKLGLQPHVLLSSPEDIDLAEGKKVVENYFNAVESLHQFAYSVSGSGKEISKDAS